MARTPKIVEDRREQIMDAAIKAFAQKGFVRATNKDIAREAGITPGLIYHYFENKEALLKAIIETRSPLRIIRKIPPEMFALPPEQFLLALVRQVVAVVEEENFGSVVRVFLPEAIHNPNVSPIGVAVLHEAIQFVSSYLAVKIESGEIRQVDPVLAAQTVIGCVVGFVLRRLILHDPLALQYTQDEIANVIVKTALHGLLPR